MADGRKIEIIGSFVDQAGPGIRKLEATIKGAFLGIGTSVKSGATGLSTFTKSMIGLGTAIVGHRIVTGLFGIAEAGAKIAAQAKGLGITTESLSEMAYAFGQVSGEAQDAAPALGRLSKVIGQIGRGDNAEARRALQDLGISLDEITSSKPDQLLLSIADSMAKLGDETEATALAASIFGKGLADKLVPTLTSGAKELQDARDKARSLGITLSDEGGKKLDNLADAWTTLKNTIGATLQKLVIELAPRFTAELEKWAVWIGDNGPHIIGFFSGVYEVAKDLVGVLADVAKSMTSIVATTGDAFLRGLGYAGSSSDREGAQRSRERDRAEAEAERRRLEDLAAPKSMGGETKQRRTDATKFLDAFHDKVQLLIRDWSDFAKAGEEAAAKVIGGGFDKLVDTLSDITLGLEKPKEAFRQLGITVATELNKIIIRLLLVKALQASIAGIGGIFTDTGGTSTLTGLASTEADVFAEKGGVMRGRMSRPMKAYEYGGIARGPQLALFGEGRNAEAFVPLPDGRSIPVTMQGGGGGGSFTFNINALDGQSVARFLYDNRKALWDMMANGVTSAGSLRAALQGAA